ncbi:hypothetical protein GCM10027053_01180 [Intrasporangium mesophilum]
MEALRCLKRRLSDAVYRQLKGDTAAPDPGAAQVGVEAGPGGYSGASSQSSAADLSTPVIGSSDQPLPGPAGTTLPAPQTHAKAAAGSAPSSLRRRAEAVKVQRPTGRTNVTATSAGAHSRSPKTAALTHGDQIRNTVGVVQRRLGHAPTLGTADMRRQPPGRTEAFSRQR